jgi:hypothetical protein
MEHVDFTKDDAQDYLDDFNNVVLDYLKTVLPEEVAILSARVLVESYEFRDLLANLWDDASYAAMAEAEVEYGPRPEIFAPDVKQNPFQYECCPRTKGGGHKFGCSVGGAQQMKVPAYVTESNQIQVSEVWRTRVFDRPVATPESED